jgi:CBS domain-containing protein
MAAAQLIQSTIDLLRPHAPFDHMEAEALRFLSARLKLAYYAKGAKVLGPASGIVDRLYIVKQGAVRGTPSAEMQADTLVDIVLGQGECFPIGALIGRRATAYDYAADSDAFLFELADADFRALLERSPAFQRFANEYLAALIDQSHRALRAQVADTVSDEGRMLAPLRQLVRRAPVSCTPSATIREVLTAMRASGVGSMVIVNEKRIPVGVFTQPDVLERVALAGADLAAPISSVMTPDPVLIAGDAPVYEAALAMVRHGIRHIVLVEDGKLLGVVSERDLFALQRASLRRAGERIRGADSYDALKEAAEDVRVLAKSLLVHGMGAEQLTQVVTALNDTLTQRVMDIASRRHGIEGEWCWIALGSEGRMEQTLATDQDNALILGEGAPDKSVFLAFADEVNRALDVAGFPLCKGDIMARNPRWCLTFAEWQEVFADWVRNPDPDALLHAAIFFDLRAISGESQLAGTLRDWLLARTAASPSFLRSMAQNALQTQPPIGLLRDFIPDDESAHPGTIDLKKYGVRPLVDAARVWALALKLPQTGTAERLRAAARAGTLPESEVSAAIEALRYIQTLRLRHQHLERPALGTENRINPDALNPLDRRILKASLRQVAKLQDRLKLDYQL